MSNVHHKRVWSTRAALAAAAFGAAAPTAAAQTTFSIDAKSPTFGAAACNTGLPIWPDDILAPCSNTGLPAPGVLPPPRLFLPAGPGGLGLPLVATFFDVDALAYGFDGPLMPAMPRGSFWFSVRRESVGLPGPFPPNVSTETPAPTSEGAADLFIDIGLPPGPVPPVAAGGGNTLAVDGNGAPSPGIVGYRSLGLIEPHGFCIPGFDPGDSVDALDVDGSILPVVGPVFFSIGSLDPCGGGGIVAFFPPAAVLVGGPAVAAPAIWAAPGALGLDLFGPGTDDLDALALFENGVAGFQASPAVYAWAPFAPFDMLLFSVSAGSAVIGSPDSVFGIPIQPGDILIPPVAGGLSPFPGIFIAAENLGLLTGRLLPVVPDDLDALDVRAQPLFDCNGNGQEDALDVATGLEADCNGNGLPDSCEFSAVAYCPSGVTSGGCTPTLTGVGVATASLSCPFQIGVSSVDGQRAGIVFYGINGPALSPWGCGGSFLCVKAPTQRTGTQSSSGTLGACDGAFSLDFNAYMASHPFALGQPLFAGEPFNFQAWFRDPSCGAATTHLSSALSFTLAP